MAVTSGKSKVGVGVIVGVSVIVGVNVMVAVGVDVRVGVIVAVGVLVGVTVAVDVGVDMAVCVIVAVGVDPANIAIGVLQLTVRSNTVKKKNPFHMNLCQGTLVPIATTLRALPPMDFSHSIVKDGIEQ
jgi:hypothetical protein